MSKRKLARRLLLALLFLMSTLPAPAAQNIQIEIVNLTWTVGVGHIASSFHAKAILPDGAHAILICQGGERGCAGFQSFAPQKSLDTGGCDREHMVETCTAAGLGYFPARREGDVLVIYVPNGKRRCRIVGSW
jgi:hypothetical protein